MHSFINRLPNELLVHILSFLDSPSPLQARLNDDPELISRPLQVDSGLPLKTASLVCRLWRRSLLQLLFRHVVWSFRRLQKPDTNNGSNDVASATPLLAFLARNGLDMDVESLTLFIDPPNTDEDQLWGVLPSGADAAALSTSAPSPSSDGDLPREVKQTQLWDNNWLWETLFSQLDPLRITLVSYPHVLASLLSREVDLSSEWAFTSHKHILSLSRSSRTVLHAARRPPPPTTTPSSSSPPPIPSTLFHTRPWTSLLINEGSFVPVYSAYEFFHFAPPTLLPVVLDPSDPSFAPLRDTLASFSYIATFPLSRHIRDVVVRCCPPVEHLYLQMMPRRADAFWRDAKLAHVDITDLWLECDMAYSIVMREVFKPADDSLNSDGGSTAKTLGSLRAFECGDTATEEAWTMAMQYVVMNGIAGWKLKQPGHFVRQDVRSCA